MIQIESLRDVLALLRAAFWALAAGAVTLLDKLLTDEGMALVWVFLIADAGFGIVSDEISNPGIFLGLLVVYSYWVAKVNLEAHHPQYHD